MKQTFRSGAEKEMIEGAVVALWVPAWADAVEEAGGRHKHGIDLTLQAPKPPANVKKAAVKWALRLESINHEPLYEIFARASKAEGQSGRSGAINPHELGYYLMMQSLGHGVSWDDSHEEFPVKLPQLEAIVYRSNNKRWAFDVSMGF